jgi:hypothetical protein
VDVAEFEPVVTTEVALFFVEFVKVVFVEVLVDVVLRVVF